MTGAESFQPDVQRARALDERMHIRLAESLEHVGERSRGIMPFDEDGLSLLVARLKEAYRFPPATFALYYDLVDAVLEERLEEAEALFGELCLQTPVQNPLAITRLDPTTMGATIADRYSRMVDTDGVTRFAFTAPASHAANDFSEQYGAAIALMAKADPELAGEFRALVCEIVLAGGQSIDGKIRFAGASSFLLWGAIIVNPNAHQSPVSLIEGLAHESAHSLLFGLMIDEPLVLNPDSERFQSPLRDDPRPIDGIFHATFVVARVHYAMQRLLSSGLLDAAGVEEVNEMLATNRKAFADGLSTVMRHGRLTNRGTAIMAAAENYMDSAAVGA